MVDEFEKMRRLIPERPDFHLHNWGVWRRGSHLTIGFDARSAGLSTGGSSGEDAFEHLCEAADNVAAEICDSIIEDLKLVHRMAISNLYECTCWKFRSMEMFEQTLIEGAVEFWCIAKRRGLT